MKKGFTLVELSIVLVIIGLLIGGLLVGQSLIESAKINSQISQFQQYDVAATNFKNKFKQMPGDSTYAPLPRIDGVAGPLNGNNNKTLIPMDASPDGCANYVFREVFLYFPQMSVLGMLKEQYVNGWANGSAAVYQPGYTFPKAKLGDGGIFVQDIKVGNVSNVQFYYYLGAKKETGPYYITQNAAGGAIFDGGVTGGLTPATAAALDNKMDDGVANTGKIAAVTTTSTGYLTGCGDYSVTYNYPWQLDVGSKYHAGCNKAANNAEYDVADKIARCRLAVKVEVN